MDTGKVSDKFGHFFEYRGVTGTPRGVNGPSWALVEERRRRPSGGARPTFGCPSLSPLRPIWPITSPGGVPVTLRHSGFLRNHPEHFRCPNIVVQYINLYVSTISRLLVMSVITSGTPNNFRYIKSHNSQYISSSNVKRADPTGSRTM